MNASAPSASFRLTRLVALLQRVPLSLVDRDALLPLAEKNRFFRAAVILLKAVSKSQKLSSSRAECLLYKIVVRCDICF